jgi:hypothetical protein
MTRATWLLLLAGCAPGSLIALDKGTTDSTDADTDTDTDADTDSDADTDIGGDTFGGETADTGPAPDPNGPTWTVDCDGGGDFVSIQAAIDAAVSGDRIGLAACTYFERIDYIGKSLEIYGIGGSAVTIIDGRGDGTLVQALVGESLGTRLAGVTLTGGMDTEQGAVLELLTGNFELDDVVITGNGPAENLIWSDGGLLDLSNVVITDNDVDDTGSAITSDGGGVTMDHVTVDCGGGAQAIHHHNAMILTDSTVTCPGGDGIYDYHGEDQIRRSVITGGNRGIYAHDTQSTPEFPDTPGEQIRIYNSAIGGGNIGAEISWMDAEIENSVFWGAASAVSLLEMDLSTSIESSGLVSATCGITTDVQYSFTYDGFWDVGTPVCGGTATSARTGDPRLVAFPTDLHLGAGSDWIDGGDPVARDMDGSRADIGQYGGPLPPL